MSSYLTKMLEIQIEEDVQQCIEKDLQVDSRFQLLTWLEEFHKW